jgi:hypothetical protein
LLGWVGRESGAHSAFWLLGGAASSFSIPAWVPVKSSAERISAVRPAILSRAAYIWASIAKTKALSNLETFSIDPFPEKWIHPITNPDDIEVLSGQALNIFLAPRI